MISMDMGLFSDDMFQRVYQYLRRHIERVPFDDFVYQAYSVEGGPAECLFVLLL